MEPVTAGAAVAGAAGATGATAGAAGAAAAAPLPSDGGFLSGIGSSIKSFVTAPFRWVASIVTAPFEAILSIPKKAAGAAWGAVKGALNLANLPVLAVVAGVETLITSTAPEAAVDLRVLAGASKEEAQQTVADIAKGGITGVALNAAKNGAIVAGLLGGASGASEGAGGGFTGLLAGAAVVAGGVVAANRFLTPSATPNGNTGGRAAGEVAKV